MQQQQRQQRHLSDMIQRIPLALLLAVILNVCHFPLTSGLRCYTCSYNKADEDDLCLTNPMALNRITDCDKKYCTIMRQEAVKPREVVSFVRGCDDTPIFLNKVVADYTFTTYFRSCIKDLCNSSDGIIGKNPNTGATNNTIIAGKSSALPAAPLTAGGVAFLWILAVGVKTLL